MGTTAAILEVVLKANTSDAERGMQNTSDKTDSLADKLRGLGGLASGVGTALSAGLSLPFVGLGVAGFTAANQLNAGMANVASLIPGNTARVQELKGAV